MFPLQPLCLRPFPLGSIRPRGWMRDQLRVQAEGLSGHLDEFWPPVAQSRWIGGPAEGWERGPYWLDGLVPLAVSLGDERLLAKAQKWVNAILESQHEDGWIGAKDDGHAGSGQEELDPWPLFVVFKALIQWQEASGDERIIPALARCAARIGSLLRASPLDSWAQMRWGDFVWTLHWLHEQTGDDSLLEVARLAHEQGFDWKGHFGDFRATGKSDLSDLNESQKLALHVVNNSMAVKSDAVWSRQSHDGSDLKSSFEILDKLFRFHGLANGAHSGDEHLAGTSPVQGVETCAVVELMYSLETLMALSGEALLGDRIERVAFNALPAALTKEMWARQYDQQPNQVWCSHARRDWVSNGADSNLFSLEGHFGCCTANFHQGWPKLLSHAWMQAPDDGLALALLLPCALETHVHGARVRVEVETSYPFEETIRLRVAEVEGTAGTFSIRVRVPAWARDARVVINGQNAGEPNPGTWAKWERHWQSGDVVELRFPQAVRVEERPSGAATLLCGPLVLALPVESQRVVLRQNELEPRAKDVEERPTSAWNFALVAPETQIGALVRALPSTTPFDSARSPLQVQVRVRSIPDWKLQNDSAAPPPQNPNCAGDEQLVELVPYGSTVLRISEFPVCE